MKLFSITINNQPYNTFSSSQATEFATDVLQGKYEKNPRYYAYFEVNSQPDREKDVKDWDLFSRSMA